MQAPTRTDIELSVFKALALVDKSTNDPDIRELTLPRETYWGPLSKRVGAMQLHRFSYTQSKELDLPRLKREVLLPSWHLIRWSLNGGTTGYIDYVTSSQDLIDYWNHQNEKVLKRVILPDMRAYWVPASLKNFTIKLRVDESGFIRNPWVPPANTPTPKSALKINPYITPAHQQQLLASLIPPTLIPRIRFATTSLIETLTSWTPHVFDSDCWHECLLKPLTQVGPLGFMEIRTPTLPDIPFEAPPHVPHSSRKVISPPGALDPTQEKNQPALKEQTGPNQKLFFH